MKNLINKYGIHILVEIFIIVVGVLIALQVNNWNESRKQNKHLKGIIQKVLDDMASDTITTNGVIKHYKPFQDAYNKVINKEVTDEYLDTCKVCRGLITSYMPYKAESSGLELLKKHVNSNSTKLQTDSTIVNLIHGQALAIETLNQMAERIKNDIDDNVHALSEKEWFADLYAGKGELIKPYRDYYKSAEFRNRTVRHKIFVENNLLAFLKIYKQSIIEKLPELKEKYESL